MLERSAARSPWSWTSGPTGAGRASSSRPVLERAADGAARARSSWPRSTWTPTRRLAARSGVQGIPAVKAFRDGEVASEFTGALPPAEVERFFDALVPSEADELAVGGDEEVAAPRARGRSAPRGRPAASSAGCCSSAARPSEALELLEGATGDFVADGLAARARARGRRGPRARVRGLGRGRPRRRRSSGSRRRWRTDPSGATPIRRMMVAIFTELGPDDPLAREYRRRLSAALN